MEKIIVEKRANDYIAYLERNKVLFGCGASPYEAIGALVDTHSMAFGVEEIVLPDER